MEKSENNCVDKKIRQEIKEILNKYTEEIGRAHV